MQYINASSSINVKPVIQWVIGYEQAVWSNHIEGHTYNWCAHVPTVDFKTLLWGYPQDLHVLLLMHSAEAHERKMKPILTEVYCKPVKHYFRNTGTCMHTNSTPRHTHEYFPQVHQCLCSVLPPVDGSLYGPWGKGLRAPKCCFSPHYCQGIHLMMDYISARAQGFPSACDLQQLWALSALAATLTMASTAQGISHWTFSLLVPHVRWAAVSQEMHRGEMRHFPLFKGSFVI